MIPLRSGKGKGGGVAAVMRRSPVLTGMTAGAAHGFSRGDHAFVSPFIMLPEFGPGEVDPDCHEMTVGIGSGPRREPVPQPPSPPGS